jgi:hypothetical protein
MTPFNFMHSERGSSQSILSNHGTIATTTTAATTTSTTTSAAGAAAVVASSDAGGGTRRRVAANDFAPRATRRRLLLLLLLLRRRRRRLPAEVSSAEPATGHLQRLSRIGTAQHKICRSVCPEPVLVNQAAPIIPASTRVAAADLSVVKYRLNVYSRLRPPVKATSLASKSAPKSWPPLKVCAAHLAQQPQLLRLTYARANETHKNDTIKTFSIAANIIR